LEMRDRPVPEECIRDYVNARTPDRFRDVFMASLGD